MINFDGKSCMKGYLYSFQHYSMMSLHMQVLTLALQLFHIERRLRTLVDDKPLLHHLS